MPSAWTFVGVVAERRQGIIRDANMANSLRGREWHRHQTPIRSPVVISRRFEYPHDAVNERGRYRESLKRGTSDKAGSAQSATDPLSVAAIYDPVILSTGKGSAQGRLSPPDDPCWQRTGGARMSA